jgi:hypothetical protein
MEEGLKREEKGEECVLYRRAERGAKRRAQRGVVMMAGRCGTGWL